MSSDISAYIAPPRGSSYLNLNSGPNDLGSINFGNLPTNESQTSEQEPNSKLTFKNPEKETVSFNNKGDCVYFTPKDENCLKSQYKPLLKEIFGNKNELSVTELEQKLGEKNIFKNSECTINKDTLDALANNTKISKTTFGAFLVYADMGNDITSEDRPVDVDFDPNDLKSLQDSLKNDSDKSKQTHLNNIKAIEKSLTSPYPNPYAQFYQYQAMINAMMTYYCNPSWGNPFYWGYY